MLVNITYLHFSYYYVRLVYRIVQTGILVIRVILSITTNIQARGDYPFTNCLAKGIVDSNVDKHDRK